MTRGKTSIDATKTHQRRPPASRGWVAFVGSGPGDPGLLTVRAVDLLREADVVITETPEHEALVRARCRGEASRTHEGAGGPELVDGGFGEDGQPLTHAARAKVVVKQAKRGLRVVRLMAGDPFLYASGPEEAQACAKAGLGFEIVPGRLLGQRGPGVRRHPADHQGPPRGRRRHLPRARSTGRQYADDRTLVLLSAVRQHRRDRQGAWSPPAVRRETPVAMTRAGTTTEQTTVVSTLDRIAADARAARMSPPAVTVVGDVVDLRETLSWFETKPLFGWRVLVPRTKEQAGALSQRLRGYGAVPEEVPTISVEPPRNPLQMDKAVRGLVEGRYEWIAFTSVNAVKAVREKFEEYGLDARAFSGLKIAAVGDKTAAGDRRLGPAGRPGAVGRAVRRRAAGGLAASTTSCSTRSTGSSCRAPTSPPRTSSPA